MTALDHMDFILKEPSDKAIIQANTADQLAGFAVAALNHDNDDLGSDTGSLGPGSVAHMTVAGVAGPRTCGPWSSSSAQSEA